MRTPLCIVLALTVGCFAQTPDSLGASARGLQNNVRNNILKAAAKLPAADYSFRPTPDVRSFAELLAHVAEDNYAFCSASLAEAAPLANIEDAVKRNPRMAKAALVDLLTESFGYCDKAYAALDDRNLQEPVKFLGRSRPRLALLNFNTAHDFEHYGNIVTYLRLKNIVPPSSERAN